MSFPEHPNSQPMGYAWLRHKYALSCIPHPVESRAANQVARQTHTVGGRTLKVYYRKAHWPGDEDFDHLEFALRREGLNLGLLRALFPLLPSHAVTDYVRRKPSSTYARRIWFLYETLTAQSLDLRNVSQGNYADLVDARLYYTGPSIRSPRHRIHMNLLGTVAFSPAVRRTPELAAWENKHLEQRCRQLLASIPTEIYERTLQFLYTKETKSSYAIEHETPDHKRAQRFIGALRAAAGSDYLQKTRLVELQQVIVEPRFANAEYRDIIGEQNYVGTTLAPGQEHVDFIPPKPDDISGLMTDFLEASRRILASKDVPPVVAAAAISYPFVFLHPFSDGNGRLHRFLIHHVLARSGFAPPGLVFPVSAAMLHRRREYDASLESFSGLVLPMIEYELDTNGRMTVLNETANLYRAIDCTVMAETLFSFVEETIERELPAEIRFLRHYDEARLKMCEIVDMPNRQADLFVRLCLQNGGSLSKKKRVLPEFSVLTGEEIANLEETIRETFQMHEGK